MSIFVKKEISLVTRWNRKVLDAATKLLGLCCFDNSQFVFGDNAFDDDLLSFDKLHNEIQIEIIDLLHEYCFYFRKIIERCHDREHAIQYFIHEDKLKTTINKDSPDEILIELCSKDLWWILGRVMHSKSVYVYGCDYLKTIVYHDGKTRCFSNNLAYVSFSSDKDNEKEHILHVPSLVKAYTHSSLGRDADMINQ